MTQETKPRRKRPSTYTQPTPNLEHGRVPPNASELEETVLGALMLESDALNDVVEILQPESFYRLENQKIFEAIMQLFSKSEPIDILTVTNWLKKDGSLDMVGGAYYVSQLTDRVASSANAEFHARIISQKFIQRELIRVSGDTYNEAFEDTTDVLDLLDKAESSLFAVAEGNLRKSYDTMGTLVKKALDEVEEAASKDGGITGVPSGFVELDRITNGWQNSDLLIIAARPAMGKTSFVLSMARNIAVEYKRPIAFFSLEMASIQLVNRLISSESGIPGEKLKKGQLDKQDWEHMHASLKQLSDAPIFIDDTAALSVFELRAKCRRLKAQHDIQMVVIDYLQLMTVGGSHKGNREQEISMISRSLKSLAKELVIPVIALSQLSRAVETRGGTKRPMLSDLRECVTGDTQVYLPEEGGFLPIRSLVGRRDFTVLSMDSDHQVRSAMAREVWSTGVKDVFEVTTVNGSCVKATANHPFYTIDGWKQVQDLKPGDHVATTRTLPFAHANGVHVTEDELVILAHMIGDGQILQFRYGDDGFNPIYSYTHLQGTIFDFVFQQIKAITFQNQILFPADECKNKLD